MELAASLRPLRKSKASAIAISPISSASIASHLLDNDAADAVGDVLEAVHHLFQMIVDLDADDVVHGVAVPVLLEQRLDAQVVQSIGIIFQPDDGFGDRVQAAGVVAQCAQQANGFQREAGGLN